MRSRLSRNAFNLRASSIYLNGALHWLCWEGVLLFFLETRTFRSIKLPKPQIGYYGLLWESGGRLCYSQLCKVEGLCIWVLETDSNWRKTYCDPVPITSKLPEDFLLFDDSDDEDGPEVELISMTEELQIMHIRLMCFCEEFHIIHIRLSYKFACYDIAERKVTPFDFPISLDSLDVAVSSSAMRYYLTEWTFNESNGRAKLPDCGTNRRLTVDDKSGKRSYERGLGSCSQGKWSVYISPTQIFRVLSIRLDEIREHNILLEEMQHQREERDRKIKGRLCLMNAHLRILEECVEAPNSIIRSCSSQGSIDGEFIGETQLDTTRDRGPVLDDVFHGHYGENERGLGSGWCQGECIIYTEMFCELLTQLDERREHIIQLQEIERQSEEWDRATEARLDLLDEQFRMIQRQ
ncbi:hypothetical protein H6P81_011458 [Aristolochia fimbriata]|uniref:F-box associated domain-containing protein n=1 Tax=Aristolochia fimbriata TaxID=158543 RepID=A0AAV7ERJ8_ARIFI|nr:hypothetical protein H6P81_011458 [Aristolochia fimbriata]